jgi:hypothetical protein
MRGFAHIGSTVVGWAYSAIGRRELLKRSLSQRAPLPSGLRRIEVILLPKARANRQRHQVQNELRR